jgi:hypothetical protein
MQLTWSKSKPIQPMFSEQTDDPFHLEPLSLKASIHARDRNSRSRPYKPRKFRFVAEQAIGQKQISTEIGEAHIQRSFACPGEKQARASCQQSNIALDRSIYQCTSTPGSPLLGTLDDGVHGKM